MLPVTNAPIRGGRNGQPSPHTAPASRAATWLALACLCVFAAGPAIAETAAETPADLSLVTHNAVTIAAPPERIWPHIVDPGDWKAGAQLVPVNGNGHRFKAVMPEDPNTALFHVINVEFDAPARRTIRLNALDGTLIGFASWELTATAGGTRVAYHVYTQQQAPPGQPPIDRDAYLQANRTRFQEELNGLKRLVEGAE